MFLVHRLHPFLENVKFQKYMGKCLHQIFEIAGFQKQALGYSKYVKSNHLSVSINGNLQEMGMVHSTDRYTLIEQSAIHINILIKQSLHGCFVAEFQLPTSKTKF